MTISDPKIAEQAEPSNLLAVAPLTNALLLAAVATLPYLEAIVNIVEIDAYDQPTGCQLVCLNLERLFGA